MRKIDLQFSRLARRAVFIVVTITCLCAVSGYSQATGDVFATLLARLQGGDATIDFKTLRFSSVKSSHEAAGEADLASRQATIAALRAGDHAGVIAAGEKVLKTSYMDLETHLMVAASYRELGNRQKFEYHQFVYLGLLDSIMAGADGKSAKTAYVVIAPFEEYAVIRALDLSSGDTSARRKEGGRSYDVIKATDPKTKQTSDVWFNVDLFVSPSR